MKENQNSSQPSSSQPRLISSISFSHYLANTAHRVRYHCTLHWCMKWISRKLWHNFQLQIPYQLLSILLVRYNIAMHFSVSFFLLNIISLYCKACFWIFILNGRALSSPKTSYQVLCFFFPFYFSSLSVFLFFYYLPMCWIVFLPLFLFLFPFFSSFNFFSIVSLSPTSCFLLNNFLPLFTGCFF